MCGGGGGGGGERCHHFLPVDFLLHAHWLFDGEDGGFLLTQSLLKIEKDTAVMAQLLLPSESPPQLSPQKSPLCQCQGEF